jgi:uncharacterized protein
MTTRRDFLAAMAAGATVLSCDSAEKAVPEASEKKFGFGTGETITFGRTNLKASRIGLGGAHFTGGKTIEEGAKFIHQVLDSGVNLIDTAWNYGADMASWRYIGAALKERSRDDFILSNKFEWKVRSPFDKLSVEEQVDESLKILNVDHFDMFLYHNLNAPQKYYDIINRGLIEDFIKVREKGKVRFIGVSGHSHPYMIHLCKRYPELDVVLGGMNVMKEYYYFDQDARHMNDYAARNNIGILSMKPFLMGALTQNHSLALKYAMTQPMSVPIPGMTENAHIVENTKAAREFSSLSLTEQKRYEDPETLLDGPACTGCKYCTLGESDNINVPELVMAAQYGERFGLQAWQSKEQRTGKKLANDLEKITPEMAKRYSMKCPRELPVEELLKKSARYV